jgi:hypothetical protein
MGISVQQLQSQLTQGLSGIGISTATQQDQLLGQAAQAQAGEAQGLGAILSAAGTTSGLGPQAFTQAFPALYAGGATEGQANSLAPAPASGNYANPTTFQ